MSTTGSRTQGDAKVVTVTLGEAVGPFIAITSDGTIAGTTEQAFGVTLEGGASGARVRVALLNGSGTVTMTAGAACTLNAAVYGAANGKITGTGGGGVLQRGIALEAATADGDRIEVAPLPPGTPG